MKENTPHPRQTKGAITLTLAAVVLFSGLWALWYTPTSTYESRKNDQITDLSFLLKPNSSANKTFEVGKEVQELSIGMWTETVLQDYDPDVGPHPQDIPSIMSATILDPEGSVIRAFDNVTSVSEGEHITVQEPGSFRVQVSNNNAENDARISLRVMDISEVPNRPMEAMGQWLTIISLPVFGLAAWFIISRHRHGRAVQQLAG